MFLKALFFTSLVIITNSEPGHYFTPPSSYAHSCNVMDYGAKGDGKTDDTASIQKAIDDCTSHGSSAQIYLPSEHTFLSKPLYVQKSCTDCSFYIHHDATLLISNDRANWPENQNFFNLASGQNWVFEGPGTIDGQGEIWWQDTNDFRPIVLVARVSHMLIQNITVKNCPAWCITLHESYNEVKYLTLINPPSTGVSVPSHNTDGIDIYGSPSYIHDCTINTGDDNVAIHSNDTLIKNCNFGSGHGASIGSLTGGWFKNITVTQITFTGTTQAARIKIHNNAGPGKLWDVNYSDLTMNKVGEGIIVTEYYDGSSNENCQMLIDEIVFENIKGTVSGNNDVGDINCQPSIGCKNIVLKDITLSGGKDTWSCTNAQVTTSNISPSWKGCS